MNCRKCKEDKELDEFVSDKNKPNGKSNLCRPCKKIVDAESYERRKEKIAKKKKIQIANFRKEYQELKAGKGCEKCSEEKHYMLDFHHLDENEKEFNIGETAWRSLNVEKVKKEIEKCIILCSNHHRELHHLMRVDGITLKEYIDM